MYQYVWQVSPHIALPRPRCSFQPGNRKGRRSHTAWDCHPLKAEATPTQQNGKTSPRNPLNIWFLLVSGCFSMFLWSRILEVSEMGNEWNVDAGMLEGYEFLGQYHAIMPVWLDAACHVRDTWVEALTRCGPFRSPIAAQQILTIANDQPKSSWENISCNPSTQWLRTILGNKPIASGKHRNEKRMMKKSIVLGSLCHLCFPCFPLL